MARDIKVQRGVATIATSATTVTLTAGVDYVAPSAASKAFCRITGTHNTSNITAATIPEDVFAATVDDSGITTSITFERGIANATYAVDVTWEIMEYVGSVGGPNEFIVRGRGLTSYVFNQNTVTTGAVSGVVTDADLMPVISGIRSAGTTQNWKNVGSRATWDAGGDTITFTRIRDNNLVTTVSWAAVEWTGSNWTVQLATHTIAAANTEETENISSIGALSRACVFQYQASCGSSTLMHSTAAEVWLSSTTQVSFYAPTGYVGGLVCHAWVLSNSQTTGDVMVVTRYDLTNTGSTTATLSPTVTLEDTSLAEISSSIDSTLSSFPRSIAQLRLTANDTMTLTRNAIETQNYRFATVTWPLAAGGGPAEQAVAGTLTPAGTLTKQVLKGASGSVAPSAALTKAAAKLFGGSTSPAGVLQRQALKVQSGTLTPAGELAAVRALLHATAGTVTSAGAVQRAPAKLTAGTVAPAGALTRDVGKVAAGTVNPTGTLTKASTRAFSGSITPSGALTALRSTLRAVTGTLGLAGAVTALRDVITQAVTGAIALSGTLVKRAERQTAGTVTPSGSVTRAVWKRVDGTLEVGGTVRREVRKTFTATLPLTGVTVTVAGTFAEPGPHPLTIRFERHGKTIGFEIHGKRLVFVKHQKTIDFEP